MMHGTPANRLTWMTIVFGFAGSLVMYAVLAYMLDQSGARVQSTSLQAMRLPVSLMAVVCLLVSVIWSQLRLAVHVESVAQSGDLPSPQRFVTYSVIALAFAEACAVFGLILFFLGAPFNELLMFIVPSAVVMLFVILPKGAGYWRAWESRREE